MKIQTIKSGAYKEYLGNALFWSIVLGLIFFLFNLIENDFVTSLVRGFTDSFLIVLILLTLGFFHKEWYLRKKKIKLLKSDKYSALNSIGLTLNNDLDYTGHINKYFVRFMTTEKRQTKKKSDIFNTVDIYTNPLDYSRLAQFINKIKSMAEIKDAAWGYGILSIYFEKQAENFPEILLFIVMAFEEYGVEPIETKVWNSSFGFDLHKSLKDMDESQSKQILKIGKFDIRYKKPAARKTNK